MLINKITKIHKIEEETEKEREHLIFHHNRSDIEGACSPSVEKDHMISTSKSSNGELSQEESEIHLKTEHISTKNSFYENKTEKLKTDYRYNFNTVPEKNSAQIEQRGKNDIKIQKL